jgi:serine/threonine-protein kinase
VYEIDGAIGAGGMGEVYRARDTKLGRAVAIKVLPPLFVNDPQRVARFQREAQLLAALNHPHIAAIYGFEEAAGNQFLILELVDGETLAAKLAARERGLHVAEALAIARQIVDALEAAHEKGIVHRDLKPGNIAFTSDGQVKVLDFGLARFDAADPASAADLAHSPTLTFAATQAGMILGTAAYMSPEQAKGRAADKRSDVWAFGCVLFEMLSGRRAFEGEDASDTIAGVLRGEPDWNALPAATPPVIHRLLRRCLAKDPRERLRDIGDVRFDLTEAATPPVSSNPEPVTTQPALVSVPRGALSRFVPWTLAAVSAVVAIAVLVITQPWRESEPPPPLTLSAELGADVSLNTAVGAGAVLSPDGQTLAFVAAGPDDSSKLYLRRLDHLAATLLAGTEDAAGPFFSADGQWIAFFAAGKLKKVSVTGGAAMTLADAPNARGGSWGDDNVIVFQPASNPGSSLLRIPAGGGTTSALSKSVPPDIQHRWPQALPGGRGVLFTASPPANFNEANIVVQPRLDMEPKVVHRGGYHARYLPSGHLVYLHQGTLFAAPFDIDRLEVTGQAVPVIEGVATNPNSGSIQMAFSQMGTVVYLSGAAEANELPVNWLDRTGKTTVLRSTPANWSNPGFSPDGERLAVDLFDGSQADVWTYDIARDTMTRLTFDAADDLRPVWSPDGRRIAFASKREKGPFSLYWQRADGTGEVQLLVKGTNDLFPGSFHPSGKFLAYFELDGKTAGNLFILPIEGDEATGLKPGTPEVFLKTDLMESSPAFSPDGRWIAYLSAETGRAELYVRPFPGPGGKWQISNGPADDPLWSRTRNELFYTAAPGPGDLRLMVAPYRTDGDSFRAEKPRVLSETRFASRPRPPSRDVDVHPDGQRFAVAPPAQNVTAAKQDKVVFVFNFFEQLKRLTGTR